MVPVTFARHVPVVQALVDDRLESPFGFDTGAGLTLVRPEMLERLGHMLEGPVHVGQRMNGRELSVPLTHLESLTIGSHRQHHPPVGAYSIRGLTSRGRPLGGMVSLGFVEDVAATLDLAGGRLILEDDDTLRERSEGGTSVPVEVRRHGAQVEIFLTLELPSGEEAKVEVDTGCDRLLLNERLKDRLAVNRSKRGLTLRSVVGHLIRPKVSVAELQGSVAVVSAPHVAERNPEVAFTDLIYDGVMGCEFLRRYPITFDLRGGRIIFGPSVRT